MRLYTKALIVLNLGAILPSFAATVLKGDSGTTTNTFSFSVGPYDAYDGALATSLMIGANEVVANNTFSVAKYDNAAGQFIPVGVSSVSLNGVANQANPLTGQKIKAISIQQDSYGLNIPTIVVDGLERFIVASSITLAKVEQPTNVTVALAQSGVPNDASGSSACGSIKQITSGQCSGESLIFGAVTQNGSAFGIGNSGIAVAKYSKPKDTPTATSLQLTDAYNGTTGNRAALFNTTSVALKVGSDITFQTVDTTPVVDLHWDATLQRLFVAVRVTAADGSANGARALAIGRLEGSTLVFAPFIPDAAVTGGSNNNIIAAKDGASVSLYKVRTMHTSTGLAYVIVNGGNNPSGTGMRTVANQIYAIPLVDERNATTWKTSATHATAADVDQMPTTRYNHDNNRFVSRYFANTATSATQLFNNTDRAAKVGAGTVPLIIPDAAVHVIKDLFVVGDAVFVCIAAAYDAAGGQIQEPGVFSSRAIFNEQGSIAAWTPWQRVAGSDDYAYGARLEATTGSFWLITGATDSTVNTVKKTLWGVGAKDGLLGGTTSDASVGLINVLDTFFPTTYSGIFVNTTFDAANNPAGIPHSGLTGQTTLLASGYKKVAFVITGDNDEAAGTIKPYTGNFAADIATSTDGSFPDGVGRVFAMSGGVLAQLGPITVQTIFSNSTHSWIAVGGINGLAVLSDADGSGFLPDDLPIGFTFKKVGNYTNVQKIFGDGTYLYVLTSNTFDRLDPVTLNSTTIATNVSIGIGANGSFADALVADKLALIATSRGLFRIANGYSVKIGVPIWQQIALGESLGPVFTLSYAACSTDYNTGLATAGQVYALGAYQGLHETRLYRLYIHEGDTISYASVQPINDLFIENVSSYFASFGQFRSAYADDGALRLAVRPAIYPNTLALYALPPYMQTGLTRFPTKNSLPLFSVVSPGGMIGSPLRLSSSGAWVVNGNFGLQVNE